MTSPAGWHPDPSPPSDGQPPQLRYWDGARWTEHTAPYPQQGYPQQVYGGGKQTTTPDGVPLAGWWQRVGATLVDVLVQIPILAVLFIPFYGRLADAFGDYVDKVDEATRTGAPAPSSTEFQADLLPVLAVMTLVSLAFGLLWTFAWLRAKQATPGKLAMGLRVRRREVPGDLPYGTIGKRWVVQYGVQLVGLVPIVGGIVSLFVFLDVLWAAWTTSASACTTSGPART